MILTAKDPSEYKRKVVQAADAVQYPVVVNIEHGDIRSTKANARYWAGVVTAIQNHLEREAGIRHNKDVIHEYLKRERYGTKIDVVNGKSVERSAKSSKMTRRQFNDFSEWAEAHAINDLGIDPIEIDNYERY